jgi:hypothetical protein
MSEESAALIHEDGALLEGTLGVAQPLAKNRGCPSVRY